MLVTRRKQTRYLARVGAFFLGKVLSFFFFFCEREIKLKWRCGFWATNNSLIELRKGHGDFCFSRRSDFVLLLLHFLFWKVFFFPVVFLSWQSWTLGKKKKIQFVGYLRVKKKKQKKIQKKKPWRGIKFVPTIYTQLSFDTYAIGLTLAGLLFLGNQSYKGLIA